MTDYKYYFNKIIGKSQIIQLIGVGGMAWVYLAKHTELGVFRAIKLLKPVDDALDSTKKKSLVERFVREAKIAASLNHRNIIKIYDVGSFEGTYYIEMEYLKGSTLKDFISEAGNVIPSEVAAMIIYMASDALYYSHKSTINYENLEIKGVVHRDIKPDNIFITETGEIKVLDFGIAKLSNVSLTTSTEARNVTGTLAYMSPEQIDGAVLGFESDIFSLGTVFYELLTGKNPFLADQMATTVKNISTCNYKPIGGIRPGLHANFSKIIDNCLKYDPKARFKSAVEIRNLSFQVLSYHGIANVEEAFRDFITTGNVSNTHTVPTRSPKFPVLKVVLAVAFLGAVITIHHFVVRPSPLPQKAVETLNSPPKPKLSAYFDSTSAEAPEVAEKPPQNVPEPVQEAVSTLSEAPQKADYTPLNRPAEKRQLKGSKAFQKTSSPPSSASRVQDLEVTSARPPVADTVAIIAEMVSTLSPALIDKGFSVIPENDQAFLFFKGILSYNRNNHVLAAQCLENSLRKPTVFKQHRLFFIENALKYKALSYSMMYNGGQSEYRDMAIKSWEGLLKISKNPQDISMAHKYLKDLR